MLNSTLLKKLQKKLHGTVKQELTEHFTIMTGILLLRSLVIGVHSVASILSSQRLLFTLVVIRTSFSPVQTQCWIIDTMTILVIM